LARIKLKTYTMKLRWMWAAVLCLSGLVSANSQRTLDRPRLIVGIVVDQMRYDYLYRYYDHYSDSGFKRLLREGFSCENALYNYAPTYTAPGHAAIYTGTTPSVNGIVANEWYEREEKRKRYVTEDISVYTVSAEGQTKDNAGIHSPRVLLSSTVTDELRLATALQSKVVGICLKDRGSILPAGHFPNACYWFEDKTGHWITSSYYESQLPEWVKAFNQQNRAQRYLDGEWDKFYPRPYLESFEGWEPYKAGKYEPISSVQPRRFSYNMKFWRDSLFKEYGYNLLRFTPGGNTITMDFALEAIDKMALGQDEYPDMLCLSFSTPDYCGHQFGIHAEEVQDIYLRLDLEVARLLKFLDERFGKHNVLVFLTADHGAAETPRHLREALRVPVGVFNGKLLDATLNSSLDARFGSAGKDSPDKWVLAVYNQQLWLNDSLIKRRNLSEKEVIKAIKDIMRSMPGVYDVLTVQEAMQLPAEYPFIAEIRRGLHPKRSGDVLFLLEPGWHADDKYFSEGGTTHGSPYPYDTHVPLLWYGWKITPGRTVQPVSITDIAPTLSAMLHIMRPNGCTGKIIETLWRD